MMNFECSGLWVCFLGGFLRRYAPRNDPYFFGSIGYDFFFRTTYVIDKSN